MVESQPSKLLVAGSIPVSRSIRTVVSDKWPVTSMHWETRVFSLVTRHSSLVTVFGGPM